MMIDVFARLDGLRGEFVHELSVVETLVLFRGSLTLDTFSGHKLASIHSYVQLDPEIRGWTISESALDDIKPHLVQILTEYT